MKVFGIVGWKNSGKTYFAQQIISILSSQNYRVASIKHAHHNFEIDKPETDSYVLRKAGSQQVIISSEKRWAKIHELKDSSEKNLNELINELENPEVVIVEGFKNDNHPKIEIIKTGNNNYLFNKISNVKAVISEEEIDTDLRQFKKNEIDSIVNFIKEDI